MEAISSYGGNPANLNAEDPRWKSRERLPRSLKAGLSDALLKMSTIPDTFQSVSQPLWVSQPSLQGVRGESRWQSCWINVHWVFLAQKPEDQKRKYVFFYSFPFFSLSYSFLQSLRVLESIAIHLFFIVFLALYRLVSFCLERWRWGHEWCSFSLFLFFSNFLLLLFLSPFSFSASYLSFTPNLWFSFTFISSLCHLPLILFAVSPPFVFFFLSFRLFVPFSSCCTSHSQLISFAVSLSLSLCIKGCC